MTLAGITRCALYVPLIKIMQLIRINSGQQFKNSSLQNVNFKVDLHAGNNTVTGCDHKLALKTKSAVSCRLFKESTKRQDRHGHGEEPSPCPDVHCK